LTLLLRKGFLRYPNFPLRFQEYGLRTTPAGLAQNIPPVLVELKPRAILVSQR
jgi:hypothetical protein